MEHTDYRGYRVIGGRRCYGSTYNFCRGDTYFRLIVKLWFSDTCETFSFAALDCSSLFTGEEIYFIRPSVMYKSVIPAQITNEAKGNFKVIDIVGTANFISV